MVADQESQFTQGKIDLQFTDCAIMSGVHLHYLIIYTKIQQHYLSLIPTQPHQKIPLSQSL